MNRSRLQKYGARARELSHAQWLATHNEKQFLTMFDVTEHRGSAYLCPHCETYRLCAYESPYLEEGCHFVCHRCETSQMDAVSFTMWCWDWSFSDARTWVLQYAKEVVAKGELIVTAPTNTVPEAEQTRAFLAGIHALVAEAMPLSASVSAGRYLSERGLLDVCIDAGIRHLGDNTEEVRVVTGRALARIDREDAQLSGVWGLEPHALESNGGLGFPFRSHNIVIPWPAPDGGTGTIRRRTSGPPPDAWPKYVMPAKAPHAPLPFMHPADVTRWMAKSHSTAVIAEGEFDALMLRREAVRLGLSADCLVVACGGTAFTGWFQSHPTWLAGLVGKAVVLALDGDEAGMSASAKCFDQLRGIGLSVSVLPPPPAGKCKDWAASLARP